MVCSCRDTRQGQGSRSPAPYVLCTLETLRMPGSLVRDAGTQKGACSGEVPREVGLLFINERYMPTQATAERSSFQPARGNLAGQKTGSRRGIKGSRVSQTAGGAEKLTQSVPRPTCGMKGAPLRWDSHLCLPLPRQRAGSEELCTFPCASIQAWNISPRNTINTIFKMSRRRKCNYEAVFN